MLDAFWSGVGEELARHWVAKVLTPAFAFWVGGGGLVWWHEHRTNVVGKGWAVTLADSARQLGELPVVLQGVLVVGALVLVAASAVIAERLTVPVLRFLEGYWTRPGWLRAVLVRYRRWRRSRADAVAQELRLKQKRGSLSVKEFAELEEFYVAPAADVDRHAQLEAAAAEGLTPGEMGRLGRARALLHSTPEQDSLGMPTRLGDQLRTAERRPADSYGIDAIVCWSALWLLLPADTRSLLGETRADLNSAIRGWLWGALFLVWTPFSLWALLVGLAVPFLSYHFGVLPRAAVYAQLIVTSYDLYRMALYDALHLPRPCSPEEERRFAGTRLTRALSGPLNEPTLTYRFEPASQGKADGTE